ncbi:MAG: hypothetical protein APR63_04550 [Desulfuromonas sp. SDB]|nr:MAG: hypothetical protein APR63_04550 [Desulfuromonas sp. SDB]
MVIAQLTMFPTDQGISVGSYVKKAVDRIRESGVKVIPGAMSTTFETETLEEVFSIVQAARDELSKSGCKRIYLSLTVDERVDKPASMETKINRIS